METHSPRSRQIQSSPHLGASRLVPLDALRGLIMILMALDHTSHFVAQQHSPGEYWGGPFPTYQSAVAFLARLVTHLSAPGFFFLLGAGMVLFAESRRRGGWSKWAIARHFWIRGGVLVALQLLVVNRAWELSPGGWVPDIYIGVLIALGGTMILASTVLWLKPVPLLALTAALVLGTALLTPAPGIWGQAFHPLTLVLLVSGGSPALWANYPVLPWLEFVAFGMVFGQWLLRDSRGVFKRALLLGAALALAFLALRYLDGFGNIRPRAGDTWIDFLNVVKYPPSITFSLLTMGVNLIVVGLFGQARENVRPWLRPLVVFGRVPLFFYLTHLFLYLGMGHFLTPHGTGVLQMVPYWLLGLLILYPLCLWYGRLRHSRPADSVLRLL